MLRRFLFGTTINDKATDAALLALRIFTGVALAVAHGFGKLPPSERFIRSVAGLGFPLPPLFAWAAALSESLGGLLLAIGLLTRPSALFIAITMATAGFLRHAPDPFTTKEKPFLFGMVALLYLLAGAGRYSLDAWISGRSRKRRG